MIKWESQTFGVNMTNIDKTLQSKLREIYNDKDFENSIFSKVRSQSQRKELIDYIDRAYEPSSSIVTIAAYLIEKGRTEELQELLEYRSIDIEDNLRTR